MPFDETGVKWSCEPCIRGHRSSKCAHFDRLMVSVGKAGRPLSKCPHVEGSCNCKKLCAFMVAIPKGTGCVCRPVYKMLLDENGPTPAVSRLPIDLTTGSSTSPSPSKIQKSGKKTVKPASEQLERALHTIPDFQQHTVQNGSPAMTPYVPHAQLNGYSYNGANGALAQPSVFPTSIGVSNGIGLSEDVFTPGACHSNSFPSTMQPQPSIPMQAQSSCCSGSRRGSPNGSKVEQRTYVQNGLPASPLISSPLIGTPSTWQGFPSMDGHFPHLSGPSNGLQSVLPDYASQVSPKDYNNPTSVNFDHISISRPDRVGSSDFAHHLSETAGHGATRSCNCGPKCNCFACPDHPYNEVTMQHVQEMGRIIAQDTQTSEDIRSYPGQNGQSNGTHDNNSETRQAILDPESHLTSGFDPPTTGNCCGVDDAVLDDDSEAQTFNSVTADHLMVPDAYYTYEYQIGLPGACAGEAGNCQCGPSCSCLGCLTHGNPP